MARRALLIGCSDYRYFSPQASASRDLERLAEVLGNSTIGDFEVEVLLDPTAHQARSSIELFFDTADETDVLLLFVATYTLEGADGRLHLAMRDTNPTLLLGTGLSADFIDRVVRQSLSQRRLLLLNFRAGQPSGAADSLPSRTVGEQDFSGRGTVVLANTESVPEVSDGEDAPFVSAIIEGLRPGKTLSPHESGVSPVALHRAMNLHYHERGLADAPRMWGTCLLPMLVAPPGPVSPSQVAPSFTDRELPQRRKVPRILAPTLVAVAVLLAWPWLGPALQWVGGRSIAPSTVYPNVDVKRAQAETRRVPSVAAQIMRPTLHDPEPVEEVVEEVLSGEAPSDGTNNALATETSDLPAAEAVAAGATAYRGSGSSSRSRSSNAITPRKSTNKARLCKKGDATACYLQAMKADRLRHDSEAREAFESACSGGHADACYRLGTYLNAGKGGLSQDRGRAAALYRWACTRDRGDACYALGSYHARGEGGMPRDRSLAAAHYAQACERGSTRGCYTLGVYHEQGLGVAQDEVQALVYFRRACDRGHARACEAIAQYYSAGRALLPKDSQAVERFYRKACQGGQSSACSSLAAPVEPSSRQ